MTPKTNTSALFGLSCISTLLLMGCNIPGLGNEQEVTESKAIGGACRHAMRGIEDCYMSNPKAIKSAVFDGWKEMDVYMRENNLQGIAPPPPPPPPPPKIVPKKSEDEEESADTDTPSEETSSSAKKKSH